MVEETGQGQANVSKHLKLLLEAGLVSRRKEGLQVFYRIGDPMVEELCSLVCRNILRDLEQDVERKGRMLGAPERAARELSAGTWWAGMGVMLR